MNIAQVTLDAWRVRMDTLRQQPLTAQLRIARGDIRGGCDILTDCHLLAAATGAEMEREGAQRPAGRPAPPTGFETSLALLDSDANKRLLALLTDALEQAKRVDEERGVEIGEGANSGLLSMLTENVAREVYGPSSGS